MPGLDGDSQIPNRGSYRYQGQVMYKNGHRQYEGRPHYYWWWWWWGKSLIISKTKFPADMDSWNLIPVKLNERKERNVTLFADLCY